MSKSTNIKKYVNIKGLNRFWENAKIYIENVAGSSSNISDIKYEAVDGDTKKYIYLVDKDGNKLGNGFDASEFIKDGMLESVEFDAADPNTLKFTWNVESGKSVIPVDLSQFVDLYTGDNESIMVDDNRKISIKSVDASKTVLNNDIVVADGPIADDTEDNWPEGWKDNLGNRIIPKDKSLEDILTGLFLKPKNGTVKWDNKATWNPTMDKPTITLSESGTVEVGTKIKINNVAEGAASGGERYAVCNCSEGYFLSTDDNATWQKGNHRIQIDGKVNGATSFSYTWNDAVRGAVEIGTTEFTVEEGANTMKVIQGGKSATSELLTTTTVWASTNSKQIIPTVSDTFTDSAELTPSTLRLSSDNTATITGARAYWVGTFKKAMDLYPEKWDAGYIKDNLPIKDDSNSTVKKLGNVSAFNLPVPLKTKQIVIITPREIADIWATKENATNKNSYITRRVEIGGVDNYKPITYYMYVRTWDATTDGSMNDGEILNITFIQS